MPGRKVYRLNFGYRSLIDWEATKAFKRGSSGGGFAQGRSGIAGPTRFTSGSQRPPLSQATSDKVPGGRVSHGLYYGVRNFNTPKLRSTKGDKLTRDEILANLDKYNQQWLYLAAEKMKQNLFDMSKDDSISQEVYSNLEKFIQADNEGLAGMGAAMAKGTLEGDMKNYGRRMVQSISTKASQWNKVGGKAWSIGAGQTLGDKTYTPDMRNVAEKAVGGALEEGQDWWTATGQNRGNTPSARFKMMFKGLARKGGPSWLGSFTQNLVKEGPDAIKLIAGQIEEHMKNSIRTGDSQRDIESALGKGAIINIPKEEQGGGATTGEKALSALEGVSSPAGVSYMTPEKVVAGKMQYIEKVEGEGVSQPIDLLFKETKKLGKGSSFNKMDLTKSFYIDPKTMKTTGHHGTTTGKKYSEQYQTSAQAEKAIVNHMRQTQLPKYNAIMKLILASVGKGGQQVVVDKRYKDDMRGVGIDMRRAREQIKTLGAQWTGRGKGTYVPKHAPGQLRQMAAQQLSNLDVQTQKVLNKLLLAKNSMDLRNTLGWVMHHMGNMLPGKGENYANVMSISINGQHSTLALVYDIDENGFYTGVNANVFDDVTPLEWLFTDQSLNLQYQGSASDAMTMGNYGLAAEALKGVAQIGVWGKFTAIDSPDPVIAMGKIIDSQYTDIMDRTTEWFFKTYMGDKMWDELKDKIHGDAVRFSHNARKPSAMYSLVKWWEYAVGQLFAPAQGGQLPPNRLTMGGIESSTRGDAETIFQHPDSPVADSGEWKTTGMRDPFWFLWAAPYMVGGFPQIGGAEQITGESTI
jgi:hypothetical protein